MKLYAQFWVYSDSNRRVDHGYIGYSARLGAKSETKGP